MGSVPLLVPEAGRQLWPWQGAGVLPGGCFLWRGSRSAAALRAGSIPVARDSLLFLPFSWHIFPQTSAGFRLRHLRASKDTALGDVTVR